MMEGTGVEVILRGVSKFVGALLIGMTVLQYPAYATTQGNMLLAHLGAQGNNAYLNFTASLADTCAWNNLYVDLTTDAGKGAYSLLLTARTSGKALTRIDYHKDAAGTCVVDLVEF